MAKRKTAWAVLNGEGQLWRGRSANSWGNHGMLFKTAGLLKTQLSDQLRYGIPSDARIIRVRITEAVEEEYSVEDFLDRWEDLKTP